MCVCVRVCVFISHVNVYLSSGWDMFSFQLPASQ